MRIRRFGAVALLAAALAVPVPAAPAAAAGISVRTAAHCRAGTPANATPTDAFFRGQAFLGPAVLPTDPPVAPLLRHYRRLGHMHTDAFIQRYRSGDGWLYPPDDGFLTRHGRPIRHAVVLRPGNLIDRFGYPGGAYLSPAGTPFAARALPPQNLDTPPVAPLSNYHEYCVLRWFRVDGGPIAPWFAQPGLGVQFKLNGAYLPAAGTALSVTWLLANGYLVEENPAEENPAEANPTTR